jgi:hypothetical protein
MLLASKPSGCVVFVWFDKSTLDVGPFAFFGGAPGAKLPDLTGMKIGRHTKGNAQGDKAERPMIRTIPLSRFDKVADIDTLVAKLFGGTATTRLDHLRRFNSQGSTLRTSR